MPEGSFKRRFGAVGRRQFRVDEQAILWHALEQIPEKYREPLVPVRFGMQELGHKPVFGWIALGDRAVGIGFCFFPERLSVFTGCIIAGPGIGMLLAAYLPAANKD